MQIIFMWLILGMPISESRPTFIAQVIASEHDKIVDDDDDDDSDSDENADDDEDEECEDVERDC